MQVLGKRGSSAAFLPDRSLQSHVTFVACGSAEGKFVAPLIILKGVFLKAKKVEGWPEAHYTVTDHGSMEGDVYAAWAKLFVKETSATKEEPVVLIVDNHSSHKDLEALKIFKDNGVRVVGLPPFTTDHLCPLDVCFFGPLKAHLKTALEPETRTTGSISIAAITRALEKAYSKAISFVDKDGVRKEESNIMKGFRMTGIWPPDRNVVLERINTEKGEATPRPAPAEVPYNPPEREMGDLSEDAHKLVLEAVEALWGRRPERKTKSTSGSIILTGEEFMCAIARKQLIKKGDRPNPAKKEKKSAEKAAKEKSNKAAAYLEQWRVTGKRKAGRPPKGVNTITGEDKAAQEEGARMGPPRKKRRVDTYYESE